MVVASSNKPSQIRSGGNVNREALQKVGAKGGIAGEYSVEALAEGVEVGGEARRPGGVDQRATGVRQDGRHSVKWNGGFTERLGFGFR